MKLLGSLGGAKVLLYFLQVRRARTVQRAENDLPFVVPILAHFYAVVVVADSAFAT
jgi:hypothetical protein